jgi:hypothetical protein
MRRVACMLGEIVVQNFEIKPNAKRELRRHAHGKWEKTVKIYIK